jgi:FlaA1/EpsC-like NDP-sugar epimerase
MKKFENKTILVTGSSGTVGSELVAQLLDKNIYNIAEIIGIDNNEGELFLQDQNYLQDVRAKFYICDIRDSQALREKMQGVDIVFHCAALKHVVLCERSPDQAIVTNIYGVKNVISSAKSENIETVIFTSSDKAVNPTNVMGTTKLMGERLITAANSHKRGSGPIYASTRFGNILGSSGSVVPIFHNQIKNGGPVTITDKGMTRFIMSVEESVKLVIDSALQAKGGEVFVTKMPVVKIIDLARAMIQELAPFYGYSPDDIKLKTIGSKPGEKLYEELMSDEEIRRSLELEKYFSVLPAFRGIYSEIDYSYNGIISTEVSNPYISENEQNLSVQEIIFFLKEYSLLDYPKSREDSRYWPGDKEELKT